jgi:hypothetical protein
MLERDKNEVEGCVQDAWNKHSSKIKSCSARNSAPSRLMNLKETKFVDETENIAHIAMQTGVLIVSRVSDTAKQPTAREHSIFTFRVSRNKNHHDDRLSDLCKSV